MKWRVIYIDSESPSGVGPVCIGHIGEPHGVYDCCPYPRIETWSEDRATALSVLLTQADAEACS